jgi:flagellar hook assembly protein FlgD
MPAAILSDPPHAAPKSFNLRNYPNPFNPTTTICFSLPAKGHVAATIYTVMGEQVTEIADTDYPAGAQTLLWDGRNAFGERVSSGLYLCRVQYNNQIETTKMVLLK